MNDLISLSELFTNKIYRIPDYQRGYAWGENQLMDFWNDLINLVDKHDHYTGLLSLKLIDTDNDECWQKSDNWILDEGYKAYYVIDGQQRLTTSIILLYTLMTFCKKNEIEYLGNTKVADIESKFIFKSPINSRFNKFYLFSYVKDDPSKDYLIYEIFEKESKPSLSETYYTLNLKHAKESFEDKIKKLYEKNNNNVVVLESLYKKLVNRFKFNIFDIENDFDVSVAFETMNNRGKKLSTLEILKNRLIYLTTIFKEEDLSKEDKNELRKDINSAWAEIYTQIGRNKNYPLNDDDFLRNHWNMYYQYYKTKGINYVTDLLNRRFTVNRYFGNDAISYEMISDEVAIDDENVEEYEDNDIEEQELESIDDEDVVDNKLTADMMKKYIDSLMNSAKHYYYVNNPEDAGKDNIITQKEVVWLKRIRRLGYVSFMPMLMALLINKDRIAEEDRITILKDIENMIFIVFRSCGFLSTYRANAFYTAARKLYKTANAGDCINFLESELNSVKPNFSQYFKGKVTKLISDGGGFFKWNELRYFLFEYELHLSTKESSPTSIIESDYFKNKAKDDDSLSIEHILPQTIDEDYGYWLNSVRGYSDKEIQILTNSLGNLLPLSQSINSSLQNDPFWKKKDGINRQNRGYKNGSLSERKVAENDDWSPTNIRDRGIDLLDFFEERWEVSFYNRKDGETSDEYKENKKKEMTSLLSLSFLDDGRTIPPRVEEIDADSVTIYSYEGNRINLIDVSKNYYANLYYSKIQKGLDENGIIYRAVKANIGYVGLRKEYEDCKFSLFANVWFQKGGLRIDMNAPRGEAIGEKRSEDYSSNFKYYVKVESADNIDKVVSELIESYEVEGEQIIGIEAIMKYIQGIIDNERNNNSEYCEISARRVQNDLGLRKAAKIICDAMNRLKTDSDIVTVQTSKKSLPYTIKYLINNH